VDLRDVVGRRDARVELGKRPEQLADVDVSGRTPSELRDVLEVVDRACAGVVEQEAVGEEAAQAVSNW